MEAQAAVSVVSVANIAKALASAQALMSPALKDADNPFFKSKYADLASVTRVVRGPLTANGIAWTQLPSASADLSSVTVRTILLHVSGETLESTISMPVKERTPQACGSALTYARRYALSAMCGLEADDDDGAQASGTVKPSRAEAIKAAIAPKEPTPWQRIEAMKPVDVSPADLASIVKKVTGKATRAQLDANDVALVQSALAAEGGAS